MHEEDYAKLFWQGMKRYTEHQHELDKPVQDGMEDYLVMSRELLDDYRRQAKIRVTDRIIAAIELEVTCDLWYTCDKCKAYKTAIAIIKKQGEQNERTDSTNNH